MTSFDKVRISGYASLCKRTKRTRRHIDEAKIEIAMFLLVVKPIVKTILRIVSIVIFILTVFAAYGGRFTPDFFTLPSILCLAAPYLCRNHAGYLHSVVYRMQMDHRRPGILSLIASWSALASITPLNFSKPAKNPANTFSLLTYNIVHGVDQQQEDAQTGNRSFEYVLHSGADIVCLQGGAGLE